MDNGRKNLIVIDNLDENLENLDQKLWQLVDNMNCNMIITSRVDQTRYAQIDINEMSIDDLLVIFYRNYPFDDDDKEICRRIIKVLNCHTFLVDLVSKQIIASHVSPQEMYDKLIENGISKPGKETVVSHKDNKTFRNTILGHLQRLYDINSMDEEDRFILFISALFGIEKINRNTLCSFLIMANEYNYDKNVVFDFFKKEPQECINYLISNGWISEERINDTYYLIIHPLIADLFSQIIDKNYLRIVYGTGLYCIYRNSRDNTVKEYRSFLDQLKVKSTFIDRVAPVIAMYIIHYINLFRTFDGDSHNKLGAIICLYRTHKLDIPKIEYELAEYLLYFREVTKYGWHIDRTSEIKKKIKKYKKEKRYELVCLWTSLLPKQRGTSIIYVFKMNHYANRYFNQIRDDDIRSKDYQEGNLICNALESFADSCETIAGIMAGSRTFNRSQITWLNIANMYLKTCATHPDFKIVCDTRIEINEGVIYAARGKFQEATKTLIGCVSDENAQKTQNQCRAYRLLGDIAYIENKKEEYQYYYQNYIGLVKELELPFDDLYFRVKRRLSQ